MNIKCVIPTRGLVHAKTLQGLKDNGITDIEIISGLPIPQSHNEAVRRTLKDYVEHVLFIEDDVVMPKGTIERMIKLNQSIVVLDYPMPNGYGCVCKAGDEILWAGLGCTLFKQAVFRQMSDPWFETNYSYKMDTENGLKLERIENPNKYGGQDINFFLKARKWGFVASQLEGEAKHLRVKTLERNENNSGGYEIYELPAISKYQNYESYTVKE